MEKDVVSVVTGDIGAKARGKYVTICFMVEDESVYYDFHLTKKQAISLMKKLEVSLTVRG